MYANSLENDGDDSVQGVATEMRLQLESLLRKGGVDIALWGHHHSYQRTCPVYNFTCVGDEDIEDDKGGDGGDGGEGGDEQDGPIHIIIGMAGYSLTTEIETPPPSWSVYVDVTEHGYTRYTANYTHMHFEYVANKGKTVKDSFVLQKSNPYARKKIVKSMH